MERGTDRWRLLELTVTSYTAFPVLADWLLRLMPPPEPGLPSTSESQKSTQCRFAAVPMDFPDHPQRLHVRENDCASICSRFRAPLALAVATGAPQWPH